MGRYIGGPLDGQPCDFTAPRVALPTEGGWPLRFTTEGFVRVVGSEERLPSPDRFWSAGSNWVTVYYDRNDDGDYEFRAEMRDE